MTLSELLAKPKRTLAEETLEVYHENERLKDELFMLKKMIYGSKSERYIPSVNSESGQLFAPDEVAEKEETPTQEIAYSRKKAQKKNSGGRNPLPEHLHREVTEIYPDDYQEGDRILGEEVSEHLEYRRGKMWVKKTVRYKTVRASDNIIRIAALPSRPIDKLLAGTSLLAHILTAKFVDHLPLYRLRQMFIREKIDIPASTIDNWIVMLAELLDPLYDRYRKRVLEKSYLQADETTLKVQDHDTKGKTHSSYLWVYHSPEDRSLYIDYQPTRGGKAPDTILKDFQGVLQTDGYEGYNKLGQRADIRRIYCMAHARRKFNDILHNYPAVQSIMEMFKDLYDVERDARSRSLSHQERQELRQDKSRLVLDKMESWLKQTILGCTPGSKLYKAIQYSLNHWEGLCEYASDGRLEIDNNWIENTIRPMAVGRKNYLFAGSHKGGERIALFYTLVANAKYAGLNPETYLQYVIDHIQDHPYHKLDDLLAQNITL